MAGVVYTAIQETQSALRFLSVSCHISPFYHDILCRLDRDIAVRVYGDAALPDLDGRASGTQGHVGSVELLFEAIEASAERSFTCCCNL